MKNNVKFALIGSGFLITALLGLYWGLGYMNSLYAFRSPLKDTPPAPGIAPVEAQTRRVVMVLIDGLRFDTSQKAEVMPYLNDLRQRSAWAVMHSRAPTYSSPSYVVLMTGAWPDVSDGPAMNQTYEDTWAMTQDNIFAIAHRQGYKTGVSAYYWYEKLIPAEVRTSGYFDEGEDDAADRAVLEGARPWLADPEYGFVLIHLLQMDYAGHYEGGPRSPNWEAAARRSDDILRQIGAYLDFSQDTLLVVSDHGHMDAGGHGGPELIVRTEPFMLVGAGVQPGAYEPVEMVDVVPTVAVLLGGNLPAAAQGRTLTEMLTLNAQQIAALREAEQAQQSALLAAYTTAIGQSAADIRPGDPVPSHQAALEAARQARHNGERPVRFLLAGIALALPLVWLIRARPRRLPLMLAGVAAYFLTFHLRYGLIDEKPYSFSAVPGPTGFLIHTGTTTLLAYLVGLGVVYLLSRRSQPAYSSSAVLGFTALLLYVLALPAGFSFGLNANNFTWILPDYASSFLSFIAAAQILFAGIAGALVAFGLAVAATFRKSQTKRVDIQPTPQAH